MIIGECALPRASRAQAAELCKGAGALQGPGAEHRDLGAGCRCEQVVLGPLQGGKALGPVVQPQASLAHRQLAGDSCCSRADMARTAAATPLRSRPAAGRRRASQPPLAVPGWNNASAFEQQEGAARDLPSAVLLLSGPRVYGKPPFCRRCFGGSREGRIPAGGAKRRREPAGCAGRRARLPAAWQPHSLLPRRLATATQQPWAHVQLCTEELRGIAPQLSTAALVRGLSSGAGVSVSLKLFSRQTSPGGLAVRAADCKPLTRQRIYSTGLADGAPQSAAQRMSAIRLGSSTVSTV